MATAKKPIKKQAAKKAAPKKEVTKTAFNWTEEKKQIATAAILKEYNRVEPNQLNSIAIDFKPNGEAVTLTKGRINTHYTHKM